MTLFNNFGCALLLLAFAGGAPGPANAQAPTADQPSRRVPVDAATTRQKAEFLENLVTRSVAASTIEESGDDMAITRLEEARALIAEAQNLLQAGDNEEANLRLDRALTLVNGETRRLSKHRVQQNHDRTVYERRLKSIRSLIAAFDRVTDEQGKSPAFIARIEEIKGIVAKAEELATAGDIDQAKDMLDAAYFETRGNIKEIREGDRLLRSLEFASAEEEYYYEVDRNNTHQMLLDLAIKQNEPEEYAISKIEEFRAEAGNLREEADGLAEREDYPGSIAALNRSTEVLLKAIRLAGIYVPG